jgi:co-chaperonin GroES (HSP10)
MTFVPHGSRILIRPDPLPEKTAGGIIKPQSVRDRERQRTLRTGVVVGMGPGMPTRKGTRWPMPNGERLDILPDVRGKRVHYFAGEGIVTPILIEGIEHHVVRDDNLDLYDASDIEGEGITEALLESEPAAGGP